MSRHDDQDIGSKLATAQREVDPISKVRLLDSVIDELIADQVQVVKHTPGFIQLNNATSVCFSIFDSLESRLPFWTTIRTKFVSLHQMKVPMCD